MPHRPLYYRKPAVAVNAAELRKYGITEKNLRVEAMMSDGVKIRAQIDAESVRNVMIVNGGGSVALLALLPSVLGTPLVFALLCTLAVWLLGLTFAVIHSVLRRKCSLVFEHHKMSPPPGSRKLGINPRRPWVCWWSRTCLNSSIVAFLCGGLTMVAISFWHLDVLTEARSSDVRPTLESNAVHRSSFKYESGPCRGPAGPEIARCLAKWEDFVSSYGTF